MDNRKFFNLTLICFVFLQISREGYCTEHPSAGKFVISAPQSLLEDANLRADELIKKYHYPGETHYVTTEDGYILTIHRISRQGAKPYLLMHGLFDSSSGFVLMGPHSSLGYFLWDQGYDVWIANARGNRYSKNHTKLDPLKDAFWNFSFHEIGVYDLPAIIDYVIEKTGQKKLYYVGHSQGCTVFFVMCSKKPEYNQKIILMHAMAPIVYLGYNKSPYFTILDKLLNSPAGKNVVEVLPRNIFLKYFCIHELTIEFICLEFIFTIMGRNKKNFNMTMFPVFTGHYPAGSSANQIRHYLQIKDLNLFQEYNYGRNENIKKYGNSNPPLYNLSRITAPIAIYYGDNDYLCDTTGLNQAYNELNSVKIFHRVPDPKWNHLDFVLGISARSILYQDIVKLGESFIDQLNS